MNTNNITTRDYREEDVSHILSIIKQAFGQYAGQLDPPSSAEKKTLEILKAELARSNALVVEVDGKLVGCVLFRKRGGGIYFERLAILPAYRNLGLAHLLLEEVEQRAIKANEPYVWLSVRLVLTRLQEFYQKIGFAFHEYGTHAGYDKPTYIKMRKYLNE